MRDAPIVELGVREISTYCDFADLAYRGIDKSGRQEAGDTYFYVHSLIAHCAMIARLLWSPELAKHAGSRTIAELLEVPLLVSCVERALGQISKEDSVLIFRRVRAAVVQSTAGDGVAPG